MPEITELLTDSPLSYLMLTALVAIDAVLPMAPSETAVVTGGVLAADGRLSLPLLVAAAMAGALAGHSVLYLLGAFAGPRLRRWLIRTELAGQRVDRAAGMLRGRTWVLIVADFIPVGRTATMFAAGALGIPAARFYAFVAPGALLWATLYTLLGYAGGSALRGWRGFMVSIGAALGIALIAESAHRLRHRPVGMKDPRDLRRTTR